MSGDLRITGGRVYDPAHGVDGVVADILIADGKVVTQWPAGRPAPRSIDAAGMVVMPGGVDIHCHIASSSVNRARMMQGEEHAAHVHAPRPDHGLRSGSGVLTPSTFTTGYLYAALGYTTALEAAVSPSGARQTHLELADTPNLDAGFLLLLANHQAVIELLAAHRRDDALALIAHLLRKTGAFGIKVVNPGGVASWRADARSSVIATLDDPVAGTTVTPRAILQTMLDAAQMLGLPHAPHVHCNRLGLPGNSAITIATLGSAQGRPIHLTHLQFHSYGATSKGDFCSDAAAVAAALDANPNASADVGQVLMGQAFTLTADTPLEYTLWKLAGKPTGSYFSVESENEAGCGLMPIVYQDQQYLHSLQWAVGMELMLMARDPWRMLLSTDHPNGGSFLGYPQIIACLMSRAVRQEQIAKLHPRALKNSAIKDLSREMSLSEIAVVTRAGPARVLGLAHKGHLGPGADGDVTIYPDDCADPQRMFANPRYVIRAGTLLVEEGQLRQATAGRRFGAALAPDERGAKALGQWWQRWGSYDVSQLGLPERQLALLVQQGRGTQRP